MRVLWQWQWWLREMVFYGGVDEVMGFLWFSLLMVRGDGGDGVMVYWL